MPGGVLLAGALNRLYQINKRTLASKDKNKWPVLKPTTADLIQKQREIEAELPQVDGFLRPGLSSGMTQARAIGMELGEARESAINWGLDLVIEERRKRQTVRTTEASDTDGL